MSATSQSLTLRERKAARTRLALIDAFRTELGLHQLSEIRIEDLAERVGVSRVTFFNYFPTKDAAVDYVYATWLFELNASLYRRQCKGVEAVLHIAEFCGGTFGKTPETMRQVQALYGAGNAFRTHPELTLAERTIIAPDLPVEGIPCLRVGTLMERSVTEARESGELEFEGDNYEFAHFLGSLMNGALLTGSQLSDQEKRDYLIRHIYRALGRPFDQIQTLPSEPETKETNERAT